MYSNKMNFVWSNVPRIVVNLSPAYEELEIPRPCEGPVRSRGHFDDVRMVE